MDILTYLLIVQ